MIQILSGEKGSGKTKRLLEMANETSKKSNGHVVFIDDDSRHMYDLHYGVRFVETSGFLICDQKVFFGFICGILSQDSDIEHIFIDGVHNIVKELSMDDFKDFIAELEKTSVDFTLIISAKNEDLPEEVKKYII